MQDSKFSQLDKQIEESRFADFDKNWAKTRQIFNYIKSNAMGQPKGAWFDRKEGDEGIYAEPENLMLESQVSGYWKGPLGKMMKYLSEEGGITLKSVAKEAGFSRYEVETLEELIRINKEAGWKSIKKRGTGGKSTP